MTASPSDEFFPEIEPDSLPALEAMDKLDQSMDGYLQACMNYAAKPTEKAFSNLTELIQEHYDSFHALLVTLGDDMTIEEMPNAFTNLIKEQDHKRVSVLNDSIEGLSLDTLSPDFSIKLTDDSLLADKTELVKELITHSAHIYAECLNADTTVLYNSISESDAAKKLTKYANYKYEAWQIGRTILGGAIGGLVVYALRKKS